MSERQGLFALMQLSCTCSPRTPSVLETWLPVDPPPLSHAVAGCLQEYDDVSALVYTLRAVLGGGNLTTQPPNTELTALSCGSAAGECDQASSGSDEPCEADAAGVGAGSKGGSRGKGGVTL